MAKKLRGRQLLVGNRLTDGRAVFFNLDTGWHADVAQATVAEGDGLDRLVDAARTYVAANEIAGFEPVEAAAPANTDTDADTDINGGSVLPSHGKPLMQSKGPSVRLDLGYQTGLGWENN